MYGRIVSSRPVILPATITPRHWASVPGVTYPEETKPRSSARTAAAATSVAIPPGYASAATLASLTGSTPGAITQALRRHSIPSITVCRPGARPMRAYLTTAALALYTATHPGETLTHQPDGWLTTSQARAILRCTETHLNTLHRRGLIRCRRVYMPDIHGRMHLQKLYPAEELANLPQK